MKLLKWAFPALAFFALALASCHKDEPAKPVVTNSVSFSLNDTTHTYSNVLAADSAGYLQISGYLSTTNNIYMVVLGGLKVGSFDIASGAAAANFTLGTADVFEATAGTITVTSLTSTNVAGTFSFTPVNLITSAAGATTTGTFQTTYTIKK